MTASCSPGNREHAQTSSVVVLQTDPSSNDYTKSFFDFDAHQNAPALSGENDVIFGVTESSTPFLVLTPAYGATGVYLHSQEDYVPGEPDFDVGDCDSVMNEFGKGGIPIPETGSYYCWLTTDDQLVEFVVEKINRSEEGIYFVEIRFVVFNNE
jgi:hypothetical protein